MVGVFIAALALLALAWKFLCGYLRKRRSQLLGALNPRKDCHSINIHTLFVEFPFLSQRSLEFGLFRTYGIPEISHLLLKAGQFTSNASKRYDDTDILVKEVLHHHIDGDRGSLALRRLNFLHSHYPIDNAEYLYVLSIFVLLPMEWSAVYGYRKWTEIEKSSYYTAWHDVGTRMGMRHIPASIPAMIEYRDDYEAKRMVYADSNKEIAETTVKLLLSDVPALVWPLARRIVYSLMDDRLLKSMGFPKQHPWLTALSHSLLKMHGLAVSCLPPRPLSWAKSRIPCGCPTSQGLAFDPDALYKLDFQRYKPSSYDRGYKIKDIGALKPGHLGDPFGGYLFCPLQECSNLQWPRAFDLSNRSV